MAAARPTGPSRPSRLAAATAGLALLAALACSGTGPGGGAGGAGGIACPGGRVRFGLAPYEDAALLTRAYEDLAAALAAHLGCPVEVRMADDSPAAVQALAAGEVDLARFGAVGVVFAHRQAGAEPLASFGDAGGGVSTYTSGIWAPAGSGVTSVGDLAGATLALSGPRSTSGDALPRTAVAAAGIADDHIDLVYTGGHAEALQALVDGSADAAAIDSRELAAAVADGRFDPAGYRQLWESAPIPQDAIAVGGGVEPAFREQVRSALLALSPGEVADAAAVLGVEPPGPLVEVTVATYQPAFDLADTLALTEEDV